MLGFQLEPLEDETVHGLLGRYGALIGPTVVRRLVRVGAGRLKRRLGVNFPAGLRYFVESGLLADMDQEAAVGRFTAVPFFSRFLPTQTYDVLRSAMWSGWPGRPSGLFGPRLGQVPPPDRLQFCPKCAEADVRACGFGTWRRSHQLPGVLCCPDHGVDLQAGELEAEATRAPKPLTTSAVDGIKVTSSIKSEVRASLARNSAWLLRNPGGPTPPVALREAVRVLLRAEGWMEPRGRVRADLREALERGLGGIDDLDDRKRVGLLGTRATWQGWLGKLWEERPSIIAHPTRYLLLLAFLRHDAADFFRIAEDLSREEGLPPPPRKKKVPGSPETIASHRASFLALKQANPDATRTELRLLGSRHYHYLLRGDRSWLMEQMPRKRLDGVRKDWSALDMTILPKVEAAIAELTAAPGRPVRITLNAIAIKVQAQALLLVNGEKLPRSFGAAMKVVENDVDLGRRRLLWAANEILRKRRSVTWSGLYVLAGVKRPYLDADERFARGVFRQLEVAASQGAPKLGATF